jgi:hypothetical protein
MLEVWEQPGMGNDSDLDINMGLSGSGSIADLKGGHVK